MFDSLKYAKVLEEVGVPRNQAEAQMQIMTEIIETNLATKQDMKDLRQEMKDLSTDIRQEMKDFQIAVGHEFRNVRQEISQSEYRLTIKLGGIVSIALGIAVTLAKLI